MKHLALAWTVALAHLAGVAASRAWAFDFDYWVNRVAWAQADGRLTVWVDNGWKIPLARGDEPIRFQLCYQSAQDEVKDGVLGAGWWVPLLESHLEAGTTSGKAKVKYYRFTEFGGRYGFVDEIKGQPGKFRAKNGLWEADEQENGRIVLKGPENWRMTYKDGTIESAVSPGGMELTWKRNGHGRVTAIVSSAGPLLEAVYDDMGCMKELTLSGGPAFQFVSGPHPRVITKDGKAEPALDGPSVQTITVSDGTTAKLKVSCATPGIYEMDLERFQQRRVIKDHLKWEAATGHLIADKEGRYVVFRHPEGGTFPEVRRILPDGRYESYWHDTVHMITHSTDLNGSKWESHGAKDAKGVSYRLEKTVKINPDGVEEWTFYEYREDGTMKTRTRFRADGVPEVTIYDEKGVPISTQ